MRESRKQASLYVRVNVNSFISVDLFTRESNTLLEELVEAAVVVVVFLKRLAKTP